jgi:asparagine synthase (glutamine-hydrolysing)
MTIATEAARSKVRLLGLRETAGWRAYPLSVGTIWFCGHLYDHFDPRIALSAWPTSGGDAAVAAFLDRLDGHFALVFEGPDCVIAAVDTVRSTPVFFWDEGDETIVATAGSELLARTGRMTVNVDAALALAMSGYTIGASTLYDNLQQLAPGEFLVAGRPHGSTRRLRYHRYAPWAVVNDGEKAFERRFVDMNLSLFQRLARQSDNRLIAVPLSAGRDSRLIVSALAEVGARNVLCFAYGLPGNFEADASQMVARHLGYDWHFVPTTPSLVRRFWTSDLNAHYQDFADSQCATTVVHDLPVISKLLDDKILDRSAIVINGNSGDYITGLHIQAPVSGGLDGLDYGERVTAIVSTIIKKHFRLWESLASAERDRVIEAALRREIAALNLGEVSADQTHGLYEYLEFQDRQSKYVIGRQRIYEFLGLEWRLPLWSRAYLDFWQTVPLHLKRGQTLYVNALTRANWGGVWAGEQWAFAPRISPAWMRIAVRPMAKALCAPFGRDAWHAFERRFLHYWMDMLAWQGIEPYWRHVGDVRGARHAIAWHTQAYLLRKGLSWDGRPLLR